MTRVNYLRLLCCCYTQMLCWPSTCCRCCVLFINFNRSIYCMKQYHNRLTVRSFIAWKPDLSHTITPIMLSHCGFQSITIMERWGEKKVGRELVLICYRNWSHFFNLWLNTIEPVRFSIWCSFHNRCFLLTRTRDSQSKTVHETWIP